MAAMEPLTRACLSKELFVSALQTTTSIAIFRHIIEKNILPKALVPMDVRPTCNATDADGRGDAYRRRRARSSPSWAQLHVTINRSNVDELAALRAREDEAHVRAVRRERKGLGTDDEDSEDTVLSMSSSDEEDWLAEDCLVRDAASLDTSHIDMEAVAAMEREREALLTAKAAKKKAKEQRKKQYEQQRRQQLKQYQQQQRAGGQKGGGGGGGAPTRGKGAGGHNPLTALGLGSEQKAFPPTVRPQRLGFTALHEACSINDAVSIGMLLGAGASMEVVDAYGRTPLCVALEFRAQRAVALLVAEGADVGGGLAAYHRPGRGEEEEEGGAHRPSPLGSSPLLYANGLRAPPMGFCETLEHLQLLLDNGAPLHYYCDDVDGGTASDDGVAPNLPSSFFLQHQGVGVDAWGRSVAAVQQLVPTLYAAPSTPVHIITRQLETAFPVHCLIERGRVCVHNGDPTAGRHKPCAHDWAALLAHEEGQRAAAADCLGRGGPLMATARRVVRIVTASSSTTRAPPPAGVDTGNANAGDSLPSTAGAAAHLLDNSSVSFIGDGATPLHVAASGGLPSVISLLVLGFGGGGVGNGILREEEEGGGGGRGGGGAGGGHTPRFANRRHNAIDHSRNPRDPASALPSRPYHRGSLFHQQQHQRHDGDAVVSTASLNALHCTSRVEVETLHTVSTGSNGGRGSRGLNEGDDNDTAGDGQYACTGAEAHRSSRCIGAQSLSLSVRRPFIGGGGLPTALALSPNTVPQHERLLEHFATLVNVTDGDGATPLHRCLRAWGFIRSGQVAGGNSSRHVDCPSLLRLLLQLGADPSLPVAVAGGGTALHLTASAVHGGEGSDVVRRLLATRFDGDGLRSVGAVPIGVRRGVSHSFSAPPIATTILFTNPSPKAAYALLHRPSFINAADGTIKGGRTALHEAIFEVNHDVMRALLLASSGSGSGSGGVCDVEAREGNGCYSAAAAVGGVEGGGGSSAGTASLRRTPLLMAAALVDPLAMQYLLHEGGGGTADVNAQDSKGMTALHYLCGGGGGGGLEGGRSARVGGSGGARTANDDQVERALRVLIGASAGGGRSKGCGGALNLNIKDAHGHVPLYYAYRNRMKGRLVDVLVKAGAKVPQPNDRGREGAADPMRPATTEVAVGGGRRMGHKSRREDEGGR